MPSNLLEEPEVLLFETSPFGTLDAIVQQDGQTVYFYLHESQSSSKKSGFGMRACWVRNLALGPMVLNADRMKDGLPPMLPRTHCVSREALPIPNPDHLQVVWLEEGNGAALLEIDPDTQDGTAFSKTIAIIPPWSGVEGFHGYAAECAVENPVCWPMPDNPKLQFRLDQASEFWQSWNQNPNPFAGLQPKLLASLADRFGETDNMEYFAIDGGNFPPRGLVQYDVSNQNDAKDSQSEFVLATVGMSVCPQPAVEIFTDTPAEYRRIELAIRVTQQDLEACDSNLEQLRQHISGLANYPWANFTWLGPGHTCGLVGAKPGCNAALLVRDEVLVEQKTELGAAVSFSAFRDDPIHLLWILPISQEQQERLQSNELTVESFLSEPV